MDLETIQVLLDLLNPLHGSVDKQVMEQVTDERELDAPSDREYNIDVTARMERDLTQAVCILEDRKRQAAALPHLQAHEWRAETERLRRMLSSVSAQCGNVIYNCEQRPADNERHLASWRGVKEFADAAIIADYCQPEAKT